jgi:dihydroorotase
VSYQPNLIPPITTVEAALSYKSCLEALAPNVKFLMSLYLHPSISPATIKAAKAASITGVKSYPAGVTTNSASGVVDYESFYPVFAAMEEEDMILNLHGESPPGEDITVLNAEERFLPTLVDLHRRFPKLRIILEHCTTAAAIEAIRSCGPTVVATITPHHMFLIVDDVVGDPINFCKPVAKLPNDRLALINAAVSGNPKFFLGTDSAPHPLHAKRGGAGDVLGKCAAGVFTQPYATQFVLQGLEQAVEKGYLKGDDVSEDVLRRFLSENGRKFYRQEMSKETIRIVAGSERVTEHLKFGPGQNVIVPFRRGETTYSIEWR